MDDAVMTEPEPAVAEPEPSTGEGQPAQEESFFDPAALSPELQGQWKRMQGAYTKRMQSIKEIRDAAEVVRRFNTDPEFAKSAIQQRAAQLGLQIGQPQAAQPGTPNQAGKPPDELVEAVKATLSPELQWMAPSLAAAQYAGMRMALQPIKQQQEQTEKQTRDREYETLASQLSEKVPGWEQHEEDMDRLLTFLQSPNMSDRRWGSKLELLHRLVVGDGQANAVAARRMAEAGKFRSPAGQPVAAPQPNVTEMVLKPKNNQDAWDAAAKFAMSELERKGIKVS